MRDFSRKPTQGERALGIVLNAALTILFGSLAVFLASRSMWIAAVTCGLLSGATIAMFYRAASGASRRLNRTQTYALAWIFLLLSLGGFLIVLLVEGSAIHRLMVLGGSVTLFSAGIFGVRLRGHDA